VTIRRAILVLGFGAGLGLGIGLIRGTQPLSANDPGSWLRLLAVLALVTLPFAWMERMMLIAMYQRRHLLDMRASDASDAPAPLTRLQAQWDWELQSLGFRRLGVEQTDLPAGRPHFDIIYADADGRITAAIMRDLNHVSFGTHFLDDFVVSTANQVIPAAVHLPHWDISRVASPGRSALPVYAAHLERLRVFASLHGDAFHVGSMADQIALEARTVNTILPEMLATRTWKHSLVEATALALVAGTWAFTTALVLGIV
jgi:hypothetical protein